MTRIVDGMLRKCGFTNHEQCHDWPTALQKLREKQFLFMMRDREMPGMNGLELVREIRSDPKIRSVPSSSCRRVRKRNMPRPPLLRGRTSS
jgi:two-component system chemotaxis response regulator CheY